MKRAFRAAIAANYLSLSVALGCGADAAGPPPASTTRLIITRSGSSAPASMTLDALGQLIFGYSLRDADSQPLPVRPVQWTSTQPGVARVANFPGADTTFQIYVDLVRNGTAKLIAQLGEEARDTVAIIVEQRAVQGFVVVDTVTALVPGAVDLDGTLVYDTLRVATYRTDANGFFAAVAAPIIFADVGDPIVRVIPEATGDTVRIIGIHPGNGTMTLRVAVTLETVATQATDRYRVARVRELGTGAIVVQPDSIIIPAGAAVLFQSDATVPTFLTSRDITKPSWRVGPIPARGVEAQIFNTPGRYLFGVAGGSAAYRVIVTP